MFILKTGQPMLVELTELVSSNVIFLSQMTLPEVKLPIWIPDCFYHSSALLDFFLLT